ncbi:MAG TPA: PaaI family thioesterase [Actinomycetota bacterium]|nr:PaaI family thioesterase [Actinomycetota bacterium]
MTDKTRFEAYVDGDFTIPANEAFGFERLATDDPKEGISFTWTVPKEYCNSAGNLQGGVLAAFADAVLGATCAAHLPAEMYPALAEMKVSFLRPARAGTTITGTGRVLKAGKRLLFVEAEITDGAGDLIAKVTGTEIPAPA